MILGIVGIIASVGIIGIIVGVMHMKKKTEQLENHNMLQSQYAEHTSDEMKKNNFTSKYFVVNHKKVGFVICLLVPIIWIVMLWGSKQIRKGIVLILATNVSTGILSAVGSGISESALDLTTAGLGSALIILALIIVGISVWLWWRYYSKCVEVLELKNKVI